MQFLGKCPPGAEDAWAEQKSRTCRMRDRQYGYACLERDMSAEQPLHAPVRLLVADSSENSAQELDSMLRDAGIPTRLRLTDLDRAADAIPTADLMLCNASLPNLDLLLPQLRLKAPHVPIILITHDAMRITTADGMRLGAADVVAADAGAEFVLVFKRELAHVCQGQRLRDVHRALKEAEQRCQLLLRGSKAAIAYVHEGMHIHANPGYLKLFGFSDVDALLGLPLMDLLSKDSAECLKNELKRLRLGDQERALDFTGASTSGEAVTGTMTLELAEYEGEPCLQVTVRGAAGDDLDAPPEALSSNGAATPGASAEPAGRPASDSAVGGPCAFLDGVHTMLDAEGGYRAILVAQVDAFAKLQEVLGLRAAEEVGRRIFDTLKDNLENRPCVRLSPHQFAFAIAASDRPHLLERVESLRRIAEASVNGITGSTITATVSIGGAELDVDQGDSAGDRFETTLNNAFAATLRAEAAGGNRLDIIAKEVGRQEIDSESVKTLAQINDAIDNHNFQLLFQPIISLRGESEEHYEVFLRMLDHQGRQMAPNEFLRTAVEHGVAAKIDRWVILQSIKMLSSHRAKGHNTRLTITLTANSISDPEFPQWLAVAIKAARLPSDTVIFQVTERDAADHMRQTRQFFTGLNAMHCRGSLSRFGLADNSMELLQHLPVDFVKLDGSHVERLAEDAKLKDEITQTIRDLQAIGKLTVIPMVESAGVLSALWQAGANYIQGHYLQEPSSEMNFDFSSDD
jgi:multidomain signaling protein FimX